MGQGGSDMVPGFLRTAGDVVFDNRLGGLLSLLIIVAVTTVAAFAYARGLRRARPRVRAVLILLRAAAVAMVLALMLNIGIAGESGREVDQVVALLFDNSMSMKIVEGTKLPRGREVLDAFAQSAGAFEAELRSRFHVVRYSFGSSVSRIDDPMALAFDQPVSDLVGALESIARDLSGASIAGVVLFSDGVQQPAQEVDTSRLRELGVPVYAVAAGSPDEWRDLRLAEYTVQRANLDKSPVVVSMQIDAADPRGEVAVAEIFDEQRVVASQEIPIDDESRRHTVTLEFVPDREGWLTCEARVRYKNDKPADADAGSAANWTPQNDARQFVVDNRARAFRVLYLTGSPTWEQKFLGRALEDDPELKLTNLVRVAGAEKKFEFRRSAGGTANPLFKGFYNEAADQPRYDEAVFLRIGADESELTSGYPASAKELYPYHVVIWGEIEHDFFSQTQLELTKSYVERRGGSFLMMGGSRSFAEGGFRGTIIDSMFPIVLRGERADKTEASLSEPFAIMPTPEGTVTGVWSLDGDPGRDSALWESLPGLFGLNAFSVLRPGASAMARVYAPGATYDGQPFFAVQRFGEGYSAAMATGATWPWHTLTPEDEESRHHRLWRQIVRSLAATVQEPALMRTKLQAITLGAPAVVDFLVRDIEFEPREGLRTSLQLLPPDGTTQNLPVEESVRESGVYSCEFVPLQPGAHTAKFTAVNEKSEVLAAIEERFIVEPDRREFENARSNHALLQTIASLTGGADVPVAHLSSVPAMIVPRRDLAPQIDVDPLWRHPILLVLLLALVVAEWYLRRTRGEP